MTPGSWLRVLGGDTVKAVYIAVACVVVAIGVNKLREDGLPLVAREAYPIFVPCPETEVEAEKVSLAEVSAGKTAFPEGTLVIDARNPEAYAAGHIPGAVNVPYDLLEGVAPDSIEGLRKAGAKRYVVYCAGWEDEEDPKLRYAHPPSEHLADELKSAGLDEVTSIEGGLAAWLEEGGELREGEEP